MANAPLADVNRHFLAGLLPHTYGNDEQKKAAAKLDKSNEPTAAQKAARQESDAMFDAYKFKSTVQLGDEAAFRAQNEAARDAAYEHPAPELDPAAAEDQRLALELAANLSGTQPPA